MFIKKSRKESLLVMTRHKLNLAESGSRRRITRQKPDELSQEKENTQKEKEDEGNGEEVSVHGGPMEQGIGAGTDKGESEKVPSENKENDLSEPQKSIKKKKGKGNFSTENPTFVLEEPEPTIAPPDMEYYEIRSDVTKGTNSRMKYPFSDMKIGNCFKFPRENRSNVLSSMYAYQKRTGRRFVLRTEDTDCFVWRVE